MACSKLQEQGHMCAPAGASHSGVPKKDVLFPEQTDRGQEGRGEGEGVGKGFTRELVVCLMQVHSASHWGLPWRGECSEHPRHPMTETINFSADAAQCER